MKRAFIILIMVGLMATVSLAETTSNIPKESFDSLANDLAEIQESIIKANTPEWRTKKYSITINGIKSPGAYIIVDSDCNILVIQRVDTGNYTVLTTTNYRITLMEVE